MSCIWMSHVTFFLWNVSFLDESFLEELMERGKTNGVQNLRIIHEDELKEIEPHIHPVSASIYISFAENDLQL